MFKYEKDKQRFLEMSPIAIAIMFDMLYYCQVNSLPFIVTSTKTTLEEDIELNRKSATHREGRAFDISVNGWKKQDIEEFDNYFSFTKSQYAAISKETLDKQLIVYHVGTAAHLHVQIHPRFVNKNLSLIKN